MYKELDFTLTFQKLRVYFENYNKALKESDPTHYKKRCLKSTHMETAKEILRFYAAYLIKNKKQKLSPERPFIISQTRVGKHKLAHQTTIYRHVRILQEGKVITNELFNGCPMGIEIRLNPDILVAKTDKKAEPKHNNAIWNRDEPCLPNVNITGLFVDNEKSRKRWKPLGLKQGHQNTPDSHSSLQEPEREKKPETQETNGEGAAATPAQLWINAFTKDAWNFAKNILYPGQQYTDNQQHQTRLYIREYFTGIKEDEYFYQHIRARFQDFGQRILLARQYTDKSPDRYIPLPWVWFNKHFEGGFKGTYGWMKQVRERRKKNRDYYSNLAVLCKIYREYCENPTLELYKKAETLLKLKQDGQLWDIFNQCVLNGQPLQLSPPLQAHHP